MASKVGTTWGIFINIAYGRRLFRKKAPDEVIDLGQGLSNIEDDIKDVIIDTIKKGFHEETPIFV